jgi:hypothetical protein
MRHNLLGQRFGKLVVLERVVLSGYRTKWKCQCDCGKTKALYTNRLTSGKAKSCGCLQTVNIEYSFEKELLLRYKYSIISSKRKWELSDEYAISLFTLPCFYCGEIGLRQLTHRKKSFTVKLNGIDRVDSKIDYIVSNVVSCCSNCNFLKNRYPQKEFYMVIKKIYEYKNLKDFSNESE